MTEKKKLKSRITNFYTALNKKDWVACHKFTDPAINVRPKPFASSHGRFFEKYGPINLVIIADVKIFKVPSKLYDNSDFASAIAVWKDKGGYPHVFAERWVKRKGKWYTRRVGLVS